MNIVLCMLIGHALGDYYFQTNKMALNKEKKLLKHVLIYTTIITIIFWWVTRLNSAVILGVVVFVTHYLIDRFNHIISNKFPNKSLLIFLLDQIFHISILIFFVASTGSILMDQNQVNQVLLLFTIILYLIMPSSILISKILETIENDTSSSNFVMDEGTIIGVLERMLVLLMGISGSMSGIGFLITAKTMVRYGQFNDLGPGKNFRSKYLIGTLSSVLIGIGLYLCFEFIK